MIIGHGVDLSTYEVRSLVGEIDVLRSDEYAKLPGASMASISLAISSTR
jgi:hypothetical protein